jgi:hypothetical protein
MSQRNGSLAAMPRLFAFVLVLPIPDCVLPGLALAAESQPRSVLANVPGLEQRITHSETKIPLGELVAKVAADTGIPLTAARDVADEPVAVVVKEFPARELLEALAELLDYRWSRRTTTDQRRTPNDEPRTTRDGGKRSSLVGDRPSVRYEIYQDLAGRQREEALRQVFSRGVEQRFQEEVAICRELAGKPQEEMKRLWEEGTRWQERLEKLTPAARWSEFVPTLPPNTPA